MDLRRVSVLGFVLAVLAICGLGLTDSIFGNSPAPIAVQALSVMLMVWARLTFGRRSFHAEANPTEGGLVTTGPYKYVRHPIYAAVIYFVWAGVLTHISGLSLLLGILVIVGLGMRMFAEERLVVKRYPDYAGYAGRTKRVIPFVL